MADVSKIQWTYATFNPWRGCTKVSAGCAHCYAETMSHRNPNVLGEWGADGSRAIAAESYWRGPVKWNREANRLGERRRVFCASLADVFEGPETMPEAYHDDITEARRRLFRLIDDTPMLDWLLLTKRPHNVREFWPDAKRRRNIWLGATTENQREFDRRHRDLIDCRDLVSVCFLSVEPMLEFVDVRPALGTSGVSWVIVGGESGSESRPFNPQWARMVLDQCRDAGVAYFFKQTGENPVGLTVRNKGGDLNDIPADLRVREFPAPESPP